MNPLLRHLLPALLLAVVLGTRCNDPQPILSILAPADGAVLEACEVEVRVHAKGTADPATLAATLNGEPLALVPHPEARSLFVATVAAGPPLAASNTLEVSVDGTEGGSSRAEVAFDFAAAEPRARRITDPADRIQGPQADGRVGDWLLENCTARFVIQDAPQRDLTSVGAYGGNLIDAELRSRPGRESFFELQPALNIESVVHAETMTIVNDGLDGSPAIVRSCGPDDLLDYINPSSVTEEVVGSDVFPPGADDIDLPIEACTEYRLAAGVSHLEIRTEVENLDPTEDVCLFVGDYLNPSGELVQWTSEPPGTNPAGSTSGIGEMPVNFALGSFSMHGFNEARGVSYGLIPLAFDDATACVAGFGAGPTSSFTQSGVSAVLQGTSIITTLFLGFPPVFRVGADDGIGSNRNAFTRAFVVGDGSAGAIKDAELALRGLPFATLSGCVTAAGAPLPGARVVVGRPAGGAIEEFSSHFLTDEDGCWEGRVQTQPAGGSPVTYAVAAARPGHPYEGGGTTPVLHTLAASAGDTIGGLDVDLPAAGRVVVEVIDQDGAGVPARVTVLGSDPSPEIVYSFSIAGQFDVRTTTFDDTLMDPLPDGVAFLDYTDASGHLAFDLEPGTYDVVVSRGTEWSSFTQAAVAVGPAPAVTAIDARIAHVLDTTGFVSSDFHVHTAPSSDSQISRTKRVRSFAGEGVDNIVATDHDRHTDLDPTIAALGFTPFVHATVGEEITTFDTGHYNAYPLGVDPDAVTGGSTDWAGAAPVGQGFIDQTPPAPYPPSYILRPDQIFAAVHDKRTVADPGERLNTSPGLAVQINHIGSHFGPLKIDSADPPLRSQLTASELATLRLDPATAPGDLFHVFDALEVWNGHDEGAQREFLDERIGIWANFLNQGLPITAIYDTDTHDFFTTRQGGARTWTPAASDDPAAIDDDALGAAVRAGKAVGGQGVYVQARLVDAGDAANRADFTRGGDTLVSVPAGAVELEIDVQAPLWAEYDTIEVYANPTTSVTGTNDGVPVRYAAAPALVLREGTDFTREVEPVHPVPGGSRFASHVVVPFAPAEDTWFAVIVKGTAGVSATMFPEMAGSAASGGVRALGATNALRLDVDGNGVFDAPGLHVAP